MGTGQPRDGTVVDPDHVALKYVPSGGGAPSSIEHVSDQGACGSGGFYLDDELLIHLCPTTCSQIEADDQGAVTVYVACTEPPV